MEMAIADQMYFGPGAAYSFAAQITCEPGSSGKRRFSFVPKSLAAESSNGSAE